MVLAPYLGAVNFGILSVCITILSVLLTISNFGFEKLLVIEFSNVSKSQSSKIFSNAFFAKMLITLSVCGLYIAFYLLSDGKSDNLHRVLIILIPNLFFNSWIIFDAFNQASNNIRKSVIIKSLAIISILLIRFILVKLNYDFETIIATYVLEQILIFSYFFIANKEFNFKILVQDLNKSVIKRILNSGFYLVSSSICVLIYSRVNQLIVSAYLDKSFVGSFSLILSIVEIPFSFAAVLSLLLLPVFSKLELNKNPEYENSIMSIFFFLGLISSLFFLFIGFFIKKYFASNFPDFAEFFTLSLLMLPFGFISYFVTLKMNAENQFVNYLKMTFLSTLLTVILSIFLITSYGKTGAILGYISGQVLSSVFVPILFINSYLNKLYASFKLLLKPKSVFLTLINVYEDRSKSY